MERNKIIECKDMEELKFIVGESEKLIKTGWVNLINLPLNTELYSIRPKDTPIDEEFDYDMHIFEEYCALFTTKEYAEAFINSNASLYDEDFVEMSEVTKCDIKTFGDMLDKLSYSILADGLVMKDVRFKDENGDWRIESVLYDPSMD